jgi:hypothetical protein
MPSEQRLCSPTRVRPDSGGWWHSGWRAHPYVVPISRAPVDRIADGNTWQARQSCGSSHLFRWAYVEAPGAARPCWSRPRARFQRQACSGIGADRDLPGPWEAGLRPASSPRKAVESMGPNENPPPGAGQHPAVRVALAEVHDGGRASTSSPRPRTAEAGHSIGGRSWSVPPTGWRGPWLASTAPTSAAIIRPAGRGWCWRSAGSARAGRPVAAGARTGERGEAEDGQRHRAHACPAAGTVAG